MIDLRNDPALPADWSGAEPGRKPIEGFLPRLSTVDPNAPDQQAAKALSEAAAELQGRKEMTLELRRTVGGAYLKARELVPTEQQLRWAGNAKLEESATAFLAQVGPHDVELLGALRRGLTLMARGVTCRVDDWSARDFIMGKRFVEHVLGIFYAVADAEEAERRRAEAAAARPVSTNSIHPPPPSVRPVATGRPLPPRRGPGRPRIHHRDD